MTPTPMDSDPAPEVDDLYYLTNFNKLLDTILQLHADLLNPADHSFIHQFRQQPQNAQQLYVRLICRRGPHFLQERLSYPEIINLPAASRQLAAAGLLQIDSPLSFTELCTLLNVADIKLLFGIKGSTKKASLQDALETEFGDQLRPFSAWCQAADAPLGSLLTPLYGDTVQRCCLIFFGNLYQDLSQFVVSDLGIMQFEPYPLERQTRPFATPGDVDTYLALHTIGEQLEALGEASSEQLQLICQPQDASRVELKRNRLIHQLGTRLERQQQLDAAVQVYHSASQAPNRERLIRVLFKQEHFQQAKRHCRALCEDKPNAEEAAFCEQFLPRIERKLGGPAVKRQREHYNEISVELADHGQRVELQVLAHYEQQGYRGVWSENDLFNALFGLLFWDVIFAPLPGVFSHPYQLAPLDFNSPTFATRRRDLFKAQLQHLKTLKMQGLQQAVLDQYRLKQGTQNPFVSWKRVSAEMLEQFVSAIPEPTLLLIMEHFCTDPRAYRAGFPDLFLWHPKRTDYLLLEVKGPGDALQNSQKRWLKVFQRIGVHYQICWVSRPIDDHARNGMV